MAEKRGRGRPKQSRYDFHVRVDAQTFYMEGKSCPEVAELLSKRLKKDITPQLIERWAVKYGWKDERKKAIIAASQEVTEGTKNSFIQRSKEHMAAYQELSSKGLQAIVDGEVDVEKIGDAVEMVDKGIRGEREVAKGLISVKLIEAVLNIIQDEVDDENAKKRIASRLQRLAIDSISV